MAKMDTNLHGKFIPTMQPGYFTPEEVIEAHKTTYADTKYDGYRVQIHKYHDDIKIFTRNGNELNYKCYPEIIEQVKKIDKTCILEAEMVGLGNAHKENFDNVKKRFRRENISQKSLDQYLKSGIIEETPLELVVFDVLSYDRKNFINIPLYQRRKLVEIMGAYDLRTANSKAISDTNELIAYMDKIFVNRGEGIVCKNPNSVYLCNPDKRTVDWVKFKRSETLDLAVLGIYNEPREGLNLPFTSVLCGTYNPETKMYETLGKIGVIRNAMAKELEPKLRNAITEKLPKNVAITEKLLEGKQRPHQFITPEKSLVLEISAMNLDFTQNPHTCGLTNGKAYSMRIAYAKQIRDDKKPTQATTTEQIAKLYKLQKED